ncbi:13817_t:CDS:1 [Ambispora leptoticha]|uniref:13817_t:CDS:1 n=1 Tax=Ambispora leptoticha TaxID=144679 RepID=A0A9N9GF29_9GLOM|nr:13817_t:CDS:1 [Ambispora leptoticha]
MEEVAQNEEETTGSDPVATPEETSSSNESLSSSPNESLFSSPKESLSSNMELDPLTTITNTNLEVNKTTANLNNEIEESNINSMEQDETPFTTVVARKYKGKSFKKNNQHKTQLYGTPGSSKQNFLGPKNYH